MRKYLCKIDYLPRSVVVKVVERWEEGDGRWEWVQELSLPREEAVEILGALCQAIAKQEPEVVV